MSVLVVASPGAAASEDGADPRTFALPETAREVVGQRTARTKRFRLPGAGRFAEVATGRPLHVRDADGRWRSTDPELALRGGRLVAERLPFRVEAGTEGVAVSEPTGTQGVVFLSAAPVERRGRALRTRSGPGGLTWEWTLSATELKLLSTPVPSALGRTDHLLPYRLWGGPADFTLDGDAQLWLGSWRFGRPLVLGADGETYEAARWRLLPGALVLEVDDTVLPAGAFPYQIDPPLTEAAAEAQSVA